MKKRRVVEKLNKTKSCFVVVVGVGLLLLLAFLTKEPTANDYYAIFTMHNIEWRLRHNGQWISATEASEFGFKLNEAGFFIICTNTTPISCGTGTVSWTLVQYLP